MGGGVGAADGLQGAAVWETGWVSGEGALGRGLEDGNLDAPLAQVLAPGEVAGCRVGSPEEELSDGSSHPGGLVTGHGGSGGDDGVYWGDGGGCCHCSGGGGGGSGGLSGHAGVSLEGCDDCEQACGISLACSGGVVCGWGAAPRAE